MSCKIDIAPLRPEQEKAWDQYVANHPDATPFHSLAYRDVLKTAYNIPNIYLAAVRDEKLVGILPLFVFAAIPLGLQLVTLPYCGAHGSLCADDPEVASALLSAARETAVHHGVRHLELKEIAPDLLDTPVVQRFADYRLHFAGNADVVWKQQMDGKARNQVRKAQKSGLAWSIGGAEHLDIFYRIYCETMHDLGSPFHSRRFFEELMFHFAATTHIGLVHKDEIPVAAMWIVTDRERATDPWAGSRRAYWNQCPNNLLYWGGITWAIENGLKTFDFGRSIRNSGHAHFKLQWGAEELPLYYYYLLNRADHPPELSPDKKSLQLAAGLWRKLPGSLVRRIGPHLIKRLPS